MDVIQEGCRRKRSGAWGGGGRDKQLASRPHPLNGSQAAVLQPLHALSINDSLLPVLEAAPASTHPATH